MIGSGGHAKVAYTAAIAAGHQVIGVVDENPQVVGNRFYDLKISPPDSLLNIPQEGLRAFIAIGDNLVRSRLADRITLPFATVIHPTAWVAPDVQIGEGTLICAGAVVQPASSIGRHAIINTHSSVDHDSSIADFAHLAPGSHTAGGILVGTGALVGVGASIAPRCAVGEWSIVGAGAVVVRDVPAHRTVKGVPAR